MALVDSLVVFVVSLLIGAFGLYMGSSVLTGEADYTYAIITALIGAIVWTIVAFFFGGIPLLGPILTLLAYVGVINWRYEGGWLNAIGIALIAWVAVFVVLYLLAILEFATYEAMGVPGI